ncbi:heparan-alpha-glucosaminide N-acetyltransferase domain-containing protein [Deinococcus sp.]|uniref:heparan-alpha-glucosaminide N-acetyltransferase domain-containing protein n=1 Tax=Deinococcus sp. TaxID=47478 RepID=UPI0028698F48|nr:heparan-alpha-glucosaminide N-acetyltransferase domain-containing protein [Deinococcus sp.]
MTAAPSPALPATITSPPASDQPATRAPRLIALDAFRGLTVLLMLLVNNVSLGSRTPVQLMHAPFGGLTLTDLVFPWFLYCAGAALPFSTAAMARSGVTGGARVGRLLERAALLYVLGAFETSVTTHTFTLGLGVLQLIALATLAGALLGGLRVRWQLLIAAALLTGYAVFLSLGTHPAGVGVIDETHNPVQALNEVLLNPIGLRGLVSVVPTTALVLLGAAAATALYRRDPRAGLKLQGMGGFLSAVGFGWAASGHLPLC